MPTKGRGSGTIFPNNLRNTEQKLFRYFQFSEAPLNADRHSVAAIRGAARPDDRVLAPAVRGTGLPVWNKRRPCQIEGSAAAITNILKRKAGSLTLARGWPLASHSLRQQKEGNRPIEREVAGTIKQVFALKCSGFLLKCPGFVLKCISLKKAVEAWYRPILGGIFFVTIADFLSVSVRVRSLEVALGLVLQRISREPAREYGTSALLKSTAAQVEAFSKTESDRPVFF